MEHDDIERRLRELKCRIENIGGERMSDEFRFETFEDAHSSIFREYLSSVIVRLPENSERYRNIQEQMEAIFKQYPRVLESVDTETVVE